MIMSNIKWIRARLYDDKEYKTTSHIFQFDKESLTIKQIKRGEYPPFDCLELSYENAVQLKDFLTECLNKIDAK